MKLTKTAAIKKAKETVFLKKIDNNYCICFLTNNGDYIIDDKTSFYNDALDFLRQDRLFSIFTFMGYEIEDSYTLRNKALEISGSLFQQVNHALANVTIG